MDTTSLPPALGLAQPVAPAQPDMRPAADAVATTTDPRPDIPLPIPASPSQAALVGKATIKDEVRAASGPALASRAAERELKPYGLPMLPDRAEDKNPRVPQDPNPIRPAPEDPNPIRPNPDWAQSDV